MDWELGTAPGRSIRLRAAVVAGIFAVGCFGVLLGRLYYIQFVRDDLYAPRAAGQQLRGITVTAPRGTIYDANLEPLAVSATAWTIRAVPREMADEDVQPATAALAEILELDVAEVLEKLSQRSSNDALLRRRPSTPPTPALPADFPAGPEPAPAPPICLFCPRPSPPSFFSIAFALMFCKIFYLVKSVYILHQNFSI